MKHTKTLMVAAALLGCTTLGASAQDRSFILCGDIRPAVPWGGHDRHGQGDQGNVERCRHRYCRLRL